MATIGLLEPGQDDASNGTHDRRHGMQVMHTAGVMKVNFLLKVRLDKVVTHGGDRASRTADEDGVDGIHVKIGRAANGHAASESRILHINWSKLVVIHMPISKRVEHGGEIEGHDSGGRQAEQGIDHCALLLCGVSSCAAPDERRPIDPQEERADEREEVISIARSGRDALMVHLGRAGQDHRDGEAEIGAEHVVRVGASDIGHLDCPLKDDLVVERMEDQLKESHDDELRGLDLADDGAEGDEHGGDAKERVHQRVDVQVDIMPVMLGGEVVVVVHLVEEGLAEGVPLQRDGREQHGEAHGAQAVRLHEGHEVAEADKPVFTHSRGSKRGGIKQRQAVAGSHHDLHPSEVEVALSDGARRVLVQQLDLTASREDDQEEDLQTQKQVRRVPPGDMGLLQLVEVGRMLLGGGGVLVVELSGETRRHGVIVALNEVRSSVDCYC